MRLAEVASAGEIARPGEIVRPAEGAAKFVGEDGRASLASMHSSLAALPELRRC
jgi:hypothetical protein